MLTRGGDGGGWGLGVEIKKAFFILFFDGERS